MPTLPLKSLFEKTRPPVPVELVFSVARRIEEESMYQSSLRARVASWSAFLSLGAFLVLLVLFSNRFFGSEFWQIVSLAFTDLSLVQNYSEEFLYSLAETFPAPSVAILLAPLFLHFVALAFRSRYTSLEMEHKTHRFSLA